MTNAELTFGALDLLSPNPPWGDYAIEATADGTSWGTPEAAVATVASMLMDGDQAAITRYGNREATVPLQIRGESLDAVADGEAALMAEVNKARNTLSWLPPGQSTASVFDVVYSTLEFKYDDLAEARQVTRYFTLTLTCLPFARRAGLTTVVAAPITSPPTVTSIDTCSSTTGWSDATGMGGTTLSVSGGTAVNLAATGALTFMSLERAGSVSVPAGNYLVLDVETARAAADYVVPWVYVDGARATVRALASQTPTITGGTGRIKAYLQLPGGATSLSKIRLDVGKSTAASSVPFTIRAHDVSTVDHLPFVGSQQQRSFLASVAGTARAQVDIDIDIVGSGDPSRSFSDALLFTAPQDAAISPPLRGWLTSSSTVTPDATCMSGARHSLAATSTYTIPMTEPQAATYLVVGRVARSSGSATTQFAWKFYTDSVYATSALDVTGSVSLTLGTAYTFVEFGVVTLPTVPTDGSGNVLLDVTSPAGASALVDDVYLFNLDTGVLTWITDIGLSGTAPNYFEIRSASLDAGLPDWRIGSALGRTISAAERAKSPGVHEFQPGLMSIFVAVPNTVSQAVTLNYYERFRHHVPPRSS